MSLTDAELLHLVADAAPPGPLAIAVSGGGDSMALLDLAIRSRPEGLQAVTVDHGLRRASADEAASVASICAARAVPHSILRWTDRGSRGNAMDLARRARADLIGRWAGSRGIGHVLTGHTIDDAAETFLMNLARKSGSNGLCGMRPTWQGQGVRWHRPLLSVGRARLRDYLRARGLWWIDDPWNADDRFTRSRARKALDALRPLGVTPETIARSAAILREEHDAVSEAVAIAASVHVVTPAGAAMCARDVLLGLDAQIRRRLLLAILRWIGGHPLPPRGRTLENLSAAIAARRDATLCGVRFSSPDDLVVASREPRAIRPGHPWDGRWRIAGPGGAEVRAVGAGLRQVPGWRATGLARQVLAVTPGLWQGDRLVAAPAAGWPQGWSAEIVLPLQAIIKAH